jgi:hypothetical protein
MLNHHSYRFTASLIELLLETKSSHRVLSAFVEFLTGFIITDALDLEEQEPPLSEHMLRRIKDYGTLGTADRLFETQERVYNTILTHYLFNTPLQTFTY